MSKVFFVIIIIIIKLYMMKNILRFKPLLNLLKSTYYSFPQAYIKSRMGQMITYQFSENKSSPIKDALKQNQNIVA